METPSNPANKQKVVEAPNNNQPLQVVTGTSLTPVGGSAPALPTLMLPPSVVDPLVGPPRRSTCSKSRRTFPSFVGPNSTSSCNGHLAANGGTSTYPLSLCGGSRHPSGRIEGSPPEGDVVVIEAPPTAIQGLPLATPQKIAGVLGEEQQGVPFTNAVMVDELPINCCTLAIAECGGSTDPREHLSHFENITMLHKYTERIKCRVFVTTFAGAENKPLREYLQRFNTAALEVPSVTQEVKANAFSQGLLDGDFFKSLAKNLVSKFDALLARATNYINIEDTQAAKKENRGEKRNEHRAEPLQEIVYWF
ncbi:UNVERIFIED_CONTAM: hypothetical protein Sindi_0946300 [Sesamum indicum]